VRYARTVGCLVLSFTIVAVPVSAQQPPSQHPLTDAASAAAAQAAANPPAHPGRRPIFITGVVLGLAGGTAIVLGSTVARTENSTSGNTPERAFASCEASRSNPVYAANRCGVLKGPNAALVIGGAIAAGAGVALALIGAPNSSVTMGPGIVRFTHHFSF
jgi:hypothetical protein